MCNYHLRLELADAIPPVAEYMMVCRVRRSAKMGIHGIKFTNGPLSARNESSFAFQFREAQELT